MGEPGIPPSIDCVILAHTHAFTSFGEMMMVDFLKSDSLSAMKHAGVTCSDRMRKGLANGFWISMSTGSYYEKVFGLRND